MIWLCPRCHTRYDYEIARCPKDSRRLIQDRTGETIAGRYVLRELLGVGGMSSTVWTAWQQSTQRQVAIKLLPSSDEDAADRFTRGARIASNLNHSNITTVHDYGVDGAQLFLVTELLEGQTLHRALGGIPMPPERVVHIATQILRGLDHAHRKNVVHRDIKPGNLYLCRKDDDSDFVKILDFGIARAADESDDQSMPGVELYEVTTTRQVCGTPQYMAPEQVTFGDIDGRTDIYAVGIVLYRMLTGRLPFTGSTHRDLFRQHLYSEPPRFSEVRPDLSIPSSIERAVMRALAKDPNDRFATAAEMRSTFQGIRVELGLTSPDSEEATPYSQQGLTPASVVVEAEPPERKKSRLLWIVALLLLLGTVATALLWPTSPKKPTALAETKQTSNSEPKISAKSPEFKPETPVAKPAASLDRGQIVDARIPDAAPKPVKAEPPTKRAVRITSGVKGSVVRLEEKVIGKTPLDVELPVGTHLLEIIDGDRRAAARIEIGPGTDRVMTHIKLPDAKVKSKPRPKVGAKHRVSRPKSKPVAEEPADPPVAEPVKKKAQTVKVQLLDESKTRSFGIGGAQKKAPPKAGDKPAIDLLE